MDPAKLAMGLNNDGSHEQMAGGIPFIKVTPKPGIYVIQYFIIFPSYSNTSSVGQDSDFQLSANTDNS